MKTTIKPLLILALAVLLSSNQNTAQNVGIGSTSFTPDASAGLEVRYTDKGVLIPNVNIADLSTADPVTSPSVSLLVYNTNETTGEGFYYWNGTEWVPIGGSNSGGGSVERYLGEEYLGGIIYYLYLDENGVQRGLIVSKTETTVAWQSSASTTNANRSWDGAFNTNLMNSSPAKNWVIGLGSGWYLPSIDELSILWHNRFHVNKSLNDLQEPLLLSNNPIPSYYWSSSEVVELGAWAFCFARGQSIQTQGSTPISLTGHAVVSVKTNEHRVRAIRAF